MGISSSGKWRPNLSSIQTSKAEPVVADYQLDVSGYRCPLPVLKAAKKLRSMTPGEILRLIATDPASQVDIPHFCSEHGHDLVFEESRSHCLVFYIRRGPAKNTIADEND